MISDGPDQRWPVKHNLLTIQEKKYTPIGMTFSKMQTFLENECYILSISYACGHTMNCLLLPGQNKPLSKVIGIVSDFYKYKTSMCSTSQTWKWILQCL